MFSINELERIRQLLEQLTPINNKTQSDDEDKRASSKKNKNHSNNCRNNPKNNQPKAEKEGCIKLIPSQLLVIAGFIGGVLEVTSVTVDRNQEIQIVLTGSLKRKTQLDEVMEQIGKMPFDQVMKSIMDNI